MADRLRAFDWSATTIGPPSGWARSMKTLVGVMLSSRQPMYLAWGPERSLIYNDAYADLLGTKHPCVAEPFFEVWSEVWPEIAPLVDQVFAGTPVHMDDITLFVDRNRDGTLEEAHFSFSYTPVLEEDGEVAGLFCPCSDTTRQVMSERAVAEAKQAAEEANLAKSTFIANMSHELRTPLSAIIGYSEMLLEEVDEGAEPAEIAGDIRKIEGNARHLLGLINDVLDLSKIESGKMEVFPETFAVEAAVREVAATVESLIGKKGNRLELDLAPDLGAMHTDVTKLRQILLNLLSNAAKFTEAGTITLSAARHGDAVDFAVTDTGIGMTPEQLSILFGRFQQADASTTRRFGGTGLGLSITKAFSSMLGGEVSVESRHGEGSTFSVRIPATLPAPPERGDEPDAPETAAGSDRIVLVIDDDPAQRELMSRFLEREGFTARTASDGATGLDLAKRLKPRAILLDVMMPGMDGWTVLGKLKADEELAAIPVVMVTFVSERGLATSLGAADYVAKPVQWERFREVMDRYRDEAGDVLVVDDDPDARARVRRALERDDWTVSEAGNGQEALDVVSRAIPRAILLDLTMPIMDGFTFLHALRERPEGRHIPVIILSARELTRDDRSRLGSAAQVLSKGELSLQEVAANVRAVAAPAG